MRIVQYRPNYFTGFENEEYQYSTVEELFSIDFVKRFSMSEDFVRYSIFDNYGISHSLMAEYNDGIEHYWYKIANLYDNKLEIPVFVATFKET
jgi:hypothetical protein